MAEKDVLRYRQAVDDIQLLVHRGDAKVESCGWIRDRGGRTLPEKLACIRGVYTRQHFDQSRLARAILAENTVHLARDDGEVHASEGRHPSERFRDSTHLEQGQLMVDSDHFRNLAEKMAFHT